MADAILILNAGSSSLKFSLHDAKDESEPLVRGHVEGIGTAPHFVARDGGGEVMAERAWSAGEPLDHEAAVEFVLEWGRTATAGRHALLATGHRVVHGGTRHRAPVRVDDATLRALAELVPLAPLHQPHNLAALRAVMRRAPGIAHVACFDTAFHRTQPEVAQAYAIPRRLSEAGIRRYGFHGLSYEFIASRLPSIDPRAASGRTVVAHLGNGASMCAMRACASIATTMGFTAVDGLPMGTRCGQLDPGVLLHLINHERMDARDVERLIYSESGLLGVSGISSDMRTLLASDDSRAREAIELFAYRSALAVGSLSAALEGLDAIVFTAGIGEHAAPVRAAICERLSWLGVQCDLEANELGGPRISTRTSAVNVWVIPTNEELVIARHTATLAAQR